MAVPDPPTNHVRPPGHPATQPPGHPDTRPPGEPFLSFQPVIEMETLVTFYFLPRWQKFKNAFRSEKRRNKNKESSCTDISITCGGFKR